MIYDLMENIDRYRGMLPALDRAIDYLERTDLHQLPDGRVDVEGDTIFVNLMTVDFAPDRPIWECHDEYLDIQIALSDIESIATMPRALMPQIEAFKQEGDAYVCEDARPGNRIKMEKNSFAICFPQDVHKPSLGEGRGRKAVVKVKVTPEPVPLPETTLNHLGTQVLTTQRLTLRPYAVSDAQAMYDNWASDTRVTDLLTWEPHESPEATKALLSQWVTCYRHPHFYHWAIERDGVLIGDMAAMSVSDRHESAEIGYCLSHAAWGQGVMTEALVAVTDFLLNQVGFSRLTVRYEVDNPRSGRVAEKAGYQLEGVRRKVHKLRGRLRDVADTAALKGEWQRPKSTGEQEGDKAHG